MSDIAFTFPLWPFVAVAIVAALLFAGLAWRTARANGAWKWVAGCAAGLCGLVAVAVSGAVALIW